MTMEKYGVYTEEKTFRVLKPIFGKADEETIGSKLSFEEAMTLANNNPGSRVEPD